MTRLFCQSEALEGILQFINGDMAPEFPLRRPAPLSPGGL